MTKSPFSPPLAARIGDCVKVYYDGDDACGWYRATIRKETFAGFVVRFEDGSEISGVQEEDLHPVFATESAPPCWPDISLASAAVDDAAKEGGGDESLRNMITNIIGRKGHCDHPGLLNVPTKTPQKKVQTVYIDLLKAIHPAKCKLPGAAEAYELVHQAFVQIFQSS